MGIINNKNTIKINAEDIKDATLSSAGILDKNNRKRAFANVLSARLAIKILFSKKVNANNLYSLYTIHNVLKQFNTSDIYFENIKIDIRPVFNKDEIFIPKTHFQYDVLPDIYIPLLLKKDLSSAEILGFFEPKNIDKSNENKDFYFFEYEQLQKPESLNKFLTIFIQKELKKATPEEIEKAENLFLELIDEDISEQDKIFLIQKLNSNIELREKLVELENFELLSQKAIEEEVTPDESLIELAEQSNFFEEEEPEEPEIQEEPIEEEPIEEEPIEEEPIEEEPIEEWQEEDEELSIEDLEEEPEIKEGSLDELQEELLEKQEEVLEEELLKEQQKIEEKIEALQEESLNELNELEEEISLEELDAPSTTTSLTEDFNEELPEIEEVNPLENISDEAFVKDEENFEFQELPELKTEDQDNKKDEEDSLDASTLPVIETAITQEGEAEKQSDVNLDDFNFDMFDEETETTNESSLPTPPAEEKEEQPSEENETEDIEETEDIQSKIDELLEDLDFSEEQKNLLTNEIKSIEELNLNIETIIDSTAETSEETTETPVETTIEPKKEDKELIKALFEKGQTGDQKLNFEMPEDIKNLTEKITTNLDRKKLIIAASVAGVMLVAVAGGVIIGTKQAPTAIEQTNTVVATNQTTPTPNEIKGIPTEGPINNTKILDENMPATPPPTSQQFQNQNRDMSAAVSEAFMSTPVNASVSKIAWEAPEDLAYNDNFRKYLQIAGKNLKLTLQNDLLLTTEMAYSNKVIVEITLNRLGAIKESKVVVSSGSKQIDNIVLQSVKETLKYLKMPTEEVQSQSIDLTLIINF